MASVSMNGEKLSNVENNNPIAFENVQVFVSNKFHGAPNVILNNFKWSTDSCS